MATIAGVDERLTWQGCVERTPSSSNNEVIRPQRLRSEDDVLYDESLLRVASLAAGVRLSFRTASPSINVKLVALGPHGPGPLRSSDGPARVDLSVDGQIVDVQCVSSDGTVELETGADRVVDVELWLPHRCPIGIESVTIADGAEFERSDLIRPTWLAHGSSITQSRFSDGPATSWTSQVARSLELDLFNLGFAGECHLEPMVARMIASMPAQLISLCSGINPYTSISMSERVYRSNLAGFVKIVRSGHPTVPMVLTSPIASPSREAVPSHPRLLPSFARRALRTQGGRLPTGTVGPTLEELRDATEEVATALIADGDANLHYLDGRSLLGMSEAEHLVDGLHPDQTGEDLIAQRYRSVLEPIVAGRSVD